MIEKVRDRRAQAGVGLLEAIALDAILAFLLKLDDAEKPQASQ